jgi:hypothetical protein
MTMELTIPTPVLPVVQYIEGLERQIAEQEMEITRLRASKASLAPVIDTVSLLSDPTRFITNDDLRTIIPVATSVFMKYVAFVPLDINPDKSTSRNLWLSADVSRIVKVLGGQELGFYSLERMMCIFEFSTSSGLHAAINRGRIPPKIQLFGSAKLPVWVKEDVNEVYLRRRCRTEGGE